MAGCLGVGAIVFIIALVYYGYGYIAAFFEDGDTSKTELVEEGDCSENCNDDEEDEEEYVIPNYPSVKIGGNEWTTQNMNTEVPGSFCYGNDPANCAKYGRLYTWDQAQEACGNGWHLPSPKEFERLSNAAEEFDGSADENVSNENFKTITIGNQVWMAENLNVATENSFCYKDDPSNCERFGRLYTWSAAKSACPNGWLLPSKLDWKQFEISMREKGFSSREEMANALRSNSWADGLNTIGFNAEPSGTRYKGEYYGFAGTATESAHYWTSTEDETDSSFAYDWFVRTDKAGLYAKNLKEERAYSVRCYRSKNVTLQAGPADLQSTKGKTGDNLKSTYGWNDKNNGNSGNGNNITKFNALPAGARDSDGEFSELGEYTYFWSSGEIKNKAFRWYLYNESSSFVRGTDNKDMALSVRCIRD